MKAEQLQSMTVKQLIEVVKSEGLTFWIASKQRKMRKGEMVEMLAAHFEAKAEAPEVAQTEQVYKIDLTKQPLESETTTHSFSEMNHLQITIHFKNLIVEALQSTDRKLQINKIKAQYNEAVTSLRDKLNERINKFEQRKWALTVKNIKCMITQFERKLKAKELQSC